MYRALFTKHGSKSKMIKSALLMCHPCQKRQLICVHAIRFVYKRAEHRLEQKQNYSNTQNKPENQLANYDRLLRFAYVDICFC